MGWFANQRRLREQEQEIARLRERNAQLEARVAALEAENARLAAQLAGARKHSGNSSKPPSSDVVKPPPRRGSNSRKRRRGGQPGHPRQTRALLPPEQIDRVVTHQVERCPVQGTVLRPSATTQRIVQQAELVAKPIEITQHELHGSWCARCQSWHWPELPAAVQAGGLLGPRLSALAGYVKSQLHVSYTGVADLFATVLGLPVCRGYLAKVLQKVSRAVSPPVDELVEALPLQPWLNVDETGHKDQGQSFWTWCFRAPQFVVFKIAARRSSAVLLEVLGREFQGVLGCDFFSAYRKYMGQCSCLVQFCLAHLIRELKFLAEHPNTLVQAYGQEVLAAVRRLFKVIHQKDELSPAAFATALVNARRLVVRAATQTEGLSPFKWVRQRIPEYRIIETMADRFRRYGEQYFTFITTPGVAPTNNLAEQAIRFVVIDRRVTQGTRGHRGQRTCERLWTVIGTCRLQGRSVFDYLVQAVTAFFQGKSPPSLLPTDTS